MRDDDVALAGRLLDLAGRAGSCPPLTDEDAGFDLARAYQVSAAIVERRIARGERPVGWKIGFTNRTIWDQYNVHAPIWGPVYDTTTAEVMEPGVSTCDISRLMEPRIEPEIVFRIASPLPAGAGEAELLASIDGVALGFELVQSPFPGWRFQAADTVAAFALHGLLRHRTFVPVTAENREAWLARLCDFTLELFRDGERIDGGNSENVLGGPLSALKAMVDGLPDTELAREIRAGDVVTTGTLTGAFPVAAGETWSTRVAGLPLDDITLALT
ncbi:2-keto-4-pentenoate hydratase [Stappia sp.]|uniref:2-keto-4-pentenoate hydratase n=1 Tax=Stappia sp. TaxID=1870903 RepID=UPI003A9A05C3